ncbi:Methyltransferase domain [Geosmithia morbida]|uniref:Protein-lysine N-methyltransferase EFM4 n=1 Tax=Geosmithia morbida TaxID=1094350 RepID=A0A9P4YYD8_9HYPO|nr:Methyltransferase domain [Geosmithia morbida]KAF4123269.1 Methyltransferase domain [Geosmithia morbida]
MSQPHPDHLPPSKLGTKSYWDKLYTTELTNHASDPSDIGTIWFDDSDAEAKITGYLSGESSLPRDTTSFLDLGCGNGSLLFSLRDGAQDSDDDDDDDDDGREQRKQQDRWTGRMLGVDYSPQSVQLARQVSSSSSSSSSSSAGKSRDNISFEEWDVLSGPWKTVLNGQQSEGWDVVLDKGTFDAISLSAGGDGDGDDDGEGDGDDIRGSQGDQGNSSPRRRPNEGYRPRVLQLVRPGGYFIITSCNWTEPELRAWFEGDDGFVLHGRVEYRSFQFGGHKGQTITTLCFRKR